MSTTQHTQEQHTRESWIAEAADFINRALGGNDETFARQTAEALAENQDGDVSTWDDPEDAAVDEMECWHD